MLNVKGVIPIITDNFVKLADLLGYGRKSREMR